MFNKSVLGSFLCLKVYQVLKKKICSKCVIIGMVANMTDKSTLEIISPQLKNALSRVLDDMGGKAWLTGGWVRNYFLNEHSKDVDIVINISALELGQRLIRYLGYGTIVPLGIDEEEACRLVLGQETLDVSSFRLGAKNVEEDLGLRDFSCNAMAFSVGHNGEIIADLIDPCDGLKDIRQRVLRSLPQAFENDGLRILRAYRFRTLYGFTIDAATRSLMKKSLPYLQNVAAERKFSEVNSIITSCTTPFRSGQVLEEMDDDGVLSQLLPELVITKGIKQPAAHHLDVWGHSFAAHKNMISLVQNYRKFLEEKKVFVIELPPLTEQEKTWLIWAALLHDIGKKPCAAKHPSDGRPTFYHHDHVGAKMIIDIGRRFRWSKAMEKNVSRLVELHMHPFHLCSSQDVRRLSIKAALKLYRRAGHLLIPLFYMALADSLASLGAGKPCDMEKQLQQLYSRVQKVYKKNIEPMDNGPRLVTGHDVIALCGVTPGPQVKAILVKVEELQVEGCLQTRDDAVCWLKKHSLDLSK